MHATTGSAPSLFPVYLGGALQLAAVALLLLVLAPAEAAAQCAVCTPCTADPDCAPGYVCRNMGAPAGMRCTQTCQTGTCPGDSVCYNYTFNGATERICLNPNAQQLGNCPASYTCTDDGLRCTGLGTSCTSGAAACSQLDAFTCLTVTEASGATSSYCTCECTSDADCDGRGTCGSNGAGQRFCMTSASSGLCANVTCPQGQVCDPGTGNCVSDPNDLCAGVVCPGGGLCSPATGTCVGGSGTDTSPADTAPDAAADTALATDTSLGQDLASGDMSGGGVSSDVAVPPGGFVLSSIFPSHGLNMVSQQVQITGQGFVPGMTLRLDALTLTAVDITSATTATATVPAAPIGLYTLHGQLPDGRQYSLPSAYQVFPADYVDRGGSATDDEGCACRTVVDGSGMPAPRPLAVLVTMLMVFGLVLVRRRPR